MNSIANVAEMLKDASFQARFEDVVSGEARRHNTFIAYIDEQGRMVREYPATAEIFLPSADRKTMRLLSVHGQEVSGADAIEIEAVAHRYQAEAEAAVH